MERSNLNTHPVCGGEEIKPWCERQLQRDIRSARWNPSKTDQDRSPEKEDPKFWIQFEAQRRVRELSLKRKPDHKLYEKIKQIAGRSKPLKEFLMSMVRSDGYLSPSHDIEVEGEMIKFFLVYRSGSEPHETFRGMSPDGTEYKLEKTLFVSKEDYPDESGLLPEIEEHKEEWEDVLEFIDSYYEREGDSVRIHEFGELEYVCRFVEDLTEEERQKLESIYGKYLCLTKISKVGDLTNLLKTDRRNSS